MPLFLLLCSLFHCADEHYQDFDAVFEKKVAERNLAENSELIDLSFDSGLYWTNGLGLVSKSVILNGNKTWLTHYTNIQKEHHRSEAENGKETLSKDTGVERWMMEVQNSSLTLQSWGLDAGMAGTTICLVVGSSVEVIDSKLLSNMECSGFVLLDGERSGSSRIVIVGSSHKSSTRNVVLPLVGRGYGQLNKNNEDWMGDGEGWSYDWAEREEIIGVGLLFDSTHFPLGTGPLFSFTGKSLRSGSDIGVIGEISTELRTSRLSNVTSTVRDGNRKKSGGGSCVWERVVGSRISGSTNHDMGTGLCGTRLGFNVVCVNSSFSSYVRTSNAEIDFEHKHIPDDIIGRTSLTSSSGMTSVKFTLCTFNDMTFDSQTSSEGGAAIYLDETKSSLTVTQCFFHKCTCTGDARGGAIYFKDWNSCCPATITLSSFTECSITDFKGGSIFILSRDEGGSLITITDCFFEKSQSMNGVTLSISTSIVTLSNCAFIECSSQGYYGGTVNICADSLDLSFLQFRECYAPNSEFGDLYVYSMGTSFSDEFPLSFSDSTSGAPNVFYIDVSGATYDLDYLVPQFQITPTVEVDVSFSEGTATVTATANTGVKGTMGLLLEGPDVPRLIHVEFGSETETSTTGTAIVSSGENGVLPNAKYSVRASSVPIVYLCAVNSSDFSISADGKTAEIVLEGFNFGDGSYSMLIQNGSNTINIPLTRSNSTTLFGSAPLPPSAASGRLEWSTEYSVESVTRCPQTGVEENVLLLNRTSFTTPPPPPPSFTEVKFSFTNSLGTGCIAILNGTDLVVGTEYEVKLNTSHTFSIVVKSSTRAESSEMLIGLEGALSYSTEILIETIEPADEDSGVVLIPSPFTGRTPARPNVNEIIVDTKTGQSDWTCGDSSRPCSTMDAAWKIVRRLGIMSPTFSLLDSTSLSSQMTVESGMSVLMRNGTHNEPSLNIPSSAAESATSALIVVSSALLNIQNIDIVVGSSQPSFVLISASSSKMILKDGLMTIKSETAGNGNEMDELCVWTTGLIDLIETELSVVNNRFFNISQGAIRMKGGIATIESSVFHDNFPSNSSFPSARRNIACSENGTVEIGSLSAGDGFKTPSVWISSEGCKVESTEVNADAPLFIPTLSSDSSSILDKKTKMLTLSIEGTILIPCSLFLKVFEMKKDGTEVNSTLIPLTVDSATSFTDTKIVVTLPSSSLETLDASLEWRGRLMFGENQTTSDSFLIQQSSSDRMAQSMKDNMKWWIPLVIVVSCALLALILIVVLLVRRRNKNKTEKDENDGEQQELDQAEDKIDVVMAEGDNDNNRNSVNTAGQKHFEGNSTVSNHHPQPLRDTNTIPSSSGQAPVLIVGEDAFGRPKIEDGFVNSHDTLFNRLHGREKTSELNIYRTRLDVAKAVAKLLSLRPNALALRKLNPHWVMFTPSNTICFALNDETPSHAPTIVPTQSGVENEAQEEKRWSAPEEENRSLGIDEQKATVFRLGLILWEITTGQVPFGETDAVNAQRQLGLGIVPGMELVSPAELSELLLECLDLNPLSRPSVESVLSRLELIGEGKKEEASDLLDLPNDPPDPQPELHALSHN